MWKCFLSSDFFYQNSEKNVNNIINFTTIWLKQVTHLANVLINCELRIVNLVVFFLFTTRLSGRLPFEDKDPQQVESKILIAKFDPTKLYPNVSQSASSFIKKMLSSYPWWAPTKVDFTLTLRRNETLSSAYMSVFSGPVRLRETASHRPGCRTPTLWSWGGRLSPSPPADSRSSWWNNNAVAPRAPPSTRCCCAPTRAHPSPRRLALHLTFPARSDITVKMQRRHMSFAELHLPTVKQNIHFLPLNCCMKNVSLPLEAQVKAHGMGRHLDITKTSKEKTVLGLWDETKPQSETER